MSKTIFVICGVIVMFLLESFLIHWGWGSFVPDLIVVLIVFFNLAFGIRYSLLAALIGGILKDSFSLSAGSTYLATFILSAFMITILKKYIYQPGSDFFRVLLMSLIIILNFLIQFVLFSYLFGRPMEIVDALKFVLFPQWIATILITPYLFDQLKKCALKFYV